MNNNQEYLSDEDLDYLDDFLLYRINEDEIDYDEEQDEGILCLSELDGFFAAVVSGPVTIPPSKWLLAVWGDFEPEFSSDEEAQKVIMLMMDIMNSTVTALMESSEEFEPLFEVSVIDSKEYTIVDEWCEGYMRGVSLSQSLWNSAGLEMQILLTPIKAFTEAGDWMAHDTSTEEEMINIRNAIAPNAQAIHAYWLQKREDSKPDVSTLRRESARIGRNEPCPCGSGKKYKKCCLH